MEKIVNIKDPVINAKYEFLIKEYYEHLSKGHIKFVKMVLVNFKRVSSNEEFLILILLYGLIFFKKININSEHICERNKSRILELQELYKYEANGNKKRFLKKIYQTEEELFDLIILIKYSVILFEDKSNNMIIKDKENYYKSIGYIIPYLTLKESKMLAFFQDAYFKHLYPEQYIKTKMIYLEKMKESGTAGEYIISIVNNLTEALGEGGILARIKMRKKSYFSIFNKIKRKQNSDFLDSIGVRILFKNLEELKKYEHIFEDKFFYGQKKDYITTPKDNGYQSLHYSFMTPYANNEVFVELQLRTIEMDETIHNAKEISHYSYTIKKNKWHKTFTEVTYGYDYLVKYIEKNR